MLKFAKCHSDYVLGHRAIRRGYDGVFFCCCNTGIEPEFRKRQEMRHGMNQ